MDDDAAAGQAEGDVRNGHEQEGTAPRTLVNRRPLREPMVPPRIGAEKEPGDVERRPRGLEDEEIGRMNPGIVMDEDVDDGHGDR